MAGSTIRAIAHAVPVHKLLHDELVARFGEKEMQSILKMTGIRERRIAAAGQCASDIAQVAIERMLDHHGIERHSIDLLIFATQTPDYRAPATASVLHGKLDLAEHCAVFDINQACGAFIHATAIAHSMIVAGTASRALVVNADTLSKLVNPNDRSLASLHGDGAVATILQAAPDGIGFEKFRICNDGKNCERIIVPAGGFRLPSSPETAQVETDDKGITRSRDDLAMDGPAVFHFAIYRVTDFIKATLAEWNLTIDDIDLVLLHQANKTMVEMIYRSLGVPKDKQFLYLEEVGNTSGCALPIALSEAWRQGRVKPGSRTLLCGFGAGLSWGMTTIRWPDTASAATPGDVDAPVVDSAP